MITDGLLNLIKEKADEADLDWKLVYAICKTESDFRPAVCRFEANYRWLYEPAKFAAELGQTIETEVMQQKFSYSIMQIMGGVARELGYEGYLPLLCAPSQGLYWGCKKLATLTKKYPGQMAHAVVSYNAGSPRFRADGSGRFVNEDYLKKVMAGFKEAQSLAQPGESGEPVIS